MGVRSEAVLTKKERNGDQNGGLAVAHGWCARKAVGGVTRENQARRRRNGNARWPRRVQPQWALPCWTRQGGTR